MDTAILLDLVAGLLVLAAVAHVASARVRSTLAPFAGDALLCLVLVGILLLAFGVTLELGVLYAGAAILAGIYWSGVAGRHPRLTGKGLAVSAGAAAGTAVVLLLAAKTYQWWYAPAAVSATLAATLLVNGLVVLWQRPAAPPPAVPRPAPPPAKPTAAPAPVPAAKVTVTCPSCGLVGQVAAMGPPTLKCPRCAVVVQRPSASPR